ncbi:MAG TPA: glycosyltransferase family 39 protein [Anaerolineales bacterium]|nr:glycosyltransferase family 39 protein [Anaerolineales bacterium]
MDVGKTIRSDTDVSRTRGSQRALTLAKVLSAALVCYFVAAFLYVSISRMGYIFTLEWLEGASLIQIQRLLSGLPLYVRPTFDYVPLIYSPLYFYVAALFARIIGFGFLPLRLVSFLATLGCVGMIYLIVRKYTQDGLVSLLAAGSFLALYKVSDSWFDLARVDMLAMFLTLLAVYLAQGRAAWRLVLAGVALALAPLAKQTYWILFVPVLVYAAFLQKRRVLYMLLTALLVSLAAHLLLNQLSGGWYSFFVYSAGFGQGSSVFAGGLRHFFTAYWIDSVLKVVPVLFVLFVAYFIVKIRSIWSMLGLLSLAAGAIVLSWAGILNKGGYNNVLIPSYVVFLICAWLLIADVMKDAASSDLVRTGLLLLFSVQMALLLYPIAAQIPTQDDYRAGQVILQDIRSQPGDVYIPFDNYLTLYAGKQPFAGFGSLGDLNQLPGGIAKAEWNRINSQLREMIKTKQFSLIILDENADWGSAERYYQSYYEPAPIKYRGDTFFPVAGWQIRPGTKYTPVTSH